MPTRTTPRYEFLTRHLDLPGATGVDDARWEPFQANLLCNDSPYQITDKSRQIAWSWTRAAEALAQAILFGHSTAFVSINLEEASEKLLYVRRMLEHLHPPFKLPKVIRDNVLTITFDNGARLMSLPGKEPRGKAQFNVVLDEFCHLKQDKKIYAAATALVVKGGSKNLKLMIGSSLMDASGQHWEISQQKLRSYPNFYRQRVPWWLTYAFCSDVREAFRLADKMTTAERVARFGKPPIVLTHEGMAEVDFQREYEAIYADEDIAWISWDEIKELQDPTLKCFSVSIKGKNIGPARQLIDQFVTQMKKLEPTFCGGVDIGRDKNTTEIFLVGRSSTKHYPLRLTITLDDCPFDEQADVLVYLLTKVPISKLFIDRNGIGRQIAESLEKRFPSKAEGVDFTNASKALWAGDAKMLAQQKKAPLPVDRDLAYQIHSIKRKVSAARNMIFDSDTNEKHHADKFWAWALALNAAIGRTENEVKARFIAYN